MVCWSPNWSKPPMVAHLFPQNLKEWKVRIEGSKPNCETVCRKTNKADLNRSWQLALKSKYSYILLVWIKFYWNTTILIGPGFICIFLSTMTKLNSLIRNRAYNICCLFLVNKFYYFVTIQSDIYFTLYIKSFFEMVLLL